MAMNDDSGDFRKRQERRDARGALLFIGLALMAAPPFLVYFDGFEARYVVSFLGGLTIVFVLMLKPFRFP